MRWILLILLFCLLWEKVLSSVVEIFFVVWNDGVLVLFVYFVVVVMWWNWK